MDWRRWNFILHRDIGYLCAGLTLIYAISGIAVNHISNDFNPSYSIEKSNRTVAPPAAGTKPDIDYIQSVLQEIGEEGETEKMGIVLTGTGFLLSLIYLLTVL